MTEELKPSATPIQATLVPVKVWIEKDMMGTVHIKRQNEGGPAFDFIQIQYSHMHTCNAFQHGLAEQIVALLNGAALTAAQRPAAQAEREAFEAFVRRQPRFAAHLLYRRDFPGSERMGQYVSMEIEFAWEAWQARASLPTQPAAQATPDQFADASKMVAPVALRSVHLTRDTAGMCVVRINGRVAIRDNGDLIDHTATLEWFADTQQATPDCVPQSLLMRLAGIAAECSDPDTADALDALIAATQQATPEPVGKPVAWRYKIPTHGGGTVWTHTRPQPECLIEAQPLYTRPAPGVPEVDMDDLPGHLAEISIAVCDGDNLAAQSGLRDAIRLIAAAQQRADQAKGVR